MSCRRRSLMSAAVLLVMVTGCADADGLAGMGFEGGDCAGNWANIALVVDPPRVVRGDPVTIVITWEVTDPLSQPVVATLVSGDGAVEVDVPLEYDPDVFDTLTYVGQQLNPFGNGAPAGTVSVLASGNQREDCLAPATAITSFELD